jgi:L-iditol 2-dehydrogenase
MKAAVYHGPGDIRVEDRSEPQARPDNLIAEITFCAICGTDLKLATIGHPRWKPPVIIGHEFCGKLVHVGGQVSGFAVGDRVTMATTVACNDCPTCSGGLQNMCPNSRPISMVCDGAFAARMAIPAEGIAGGNVVKVPGSVSDESACLAEPLSCAINAQEIAGVQPGDAVLVVGGGPLGALHAELAKAFGAAKVMISQRSEPRLSLLKQLADVTVIDGNADVEARVKDETNGLGADVVVVCAPNRTAQEQSLRLVRKGGSVSLFASLPKSDSDITLDSRAIHYGELRIVGASDSRPEHVETAIRLLAEGAINVDTILTHRVPLERIHEGFDLMKNRASLKVLVVPTDK